MCCSFWNIHYCNLHEIWMVFAAGGIYFFATPTVIHYNGIATNVCSHSFSIVLFISIWSRSQVAIFPTIHCHFVLWHNILGHVLQLKLGWEKLHCPFFQFFIWQNVIAKATPVCKLIINQGQLKATCLQCSRRFFSN